MNIAVKSLSFSLDEKQILENIWIDIKNKESIGIIGPNGSGKSTLLKCIYRTLKPDEGVVALDGRNIQTFSLRETARLVAVVSQHNEMQFNPTVEEMVLLGRSPYKKFMETDTDADFALVDEALKKVGLEELKHRDFRSLSGGERQRTLLARALAQNPKCLILDEPTNHLDIRYQLQFMSTARKLGITVISAMHDLGIASLYCDRIYALKDGKILVCGTPLEVLTQENIYALYGIKVEITKDSRGNPHILYIDL